ncbi:hypothetical protein [Spirosoma pollinicola]|uniref:Uncharacterized protein n=1 Tax=Spirosoma pollinicola TaxID=2057025 RepID=A0A2K8YTN8_9BACT|nr:hypothetical protein [Spirosoma pollinicola]AUD00928.1 hypothetical protein CWM47_03320 [Spirosoma pollinicola]
MDLNYSINAVPFSQLGIHVTRSSGVVDGLELKDPFRVDWPDAHGEVVDLSRPRFQARTITLESWMVAPSADSFITQFNSLLTELVRSNTQRLKLTPVTGKPLVFEVYAKGNLSVKKEWRDGAMVGEFTLSLIEPQPVKYVLIGTGNSTASIRLTAPTPITLYWGDGTKTQMQGTNQTLTHSYGGSGTAKYYLIISGELERMSVQEKTNLTDLWPRLY